MVTPLSHATTLLCRLNPVIQGIADQVQQRIGNGLHHRFVQFCLFTADLKVNFFLQFLGQLSNRQLQPLKDLGRDYKVLPIYFVPADRQPVANYRKKITVLMTFVADLYRRDLNAKGYKTRGLDFVFKNGQLDVRLVRGDRKAAFYSGAPNYNKNTLWNTVSAALVQKVGHPINRLYVVMTETQGDGPVGGRFPGENAESAPVNPYSGFALVSAWMLHDQIAATSIRQHLQFMNDPKPVKKRPRAGIR